MGLYLIILVNQITGASSRVVAAMNVANALEQVEANVDELKELKELSINTYETSDDSGTTYYIHQKM